MEGKRCSVCSGASPTQGVFQSGCTSVNAGSRSSSSPGAVGCTPRSRGLPQQRGAGGAGCCSLLQRDQKVVPTDSRWPAAALDFDVPTGQSVVTQIVAPSQDPASPFLFIWKCAWAPYRALISSS